MHVTSRSYLTAGVAALGVGAIALTPIQPLPAHTALAPERAVSTMAVELAGIIDPWVATFGTAVENAQRLNAAWTASTFPIFQTWATNQLTYAKEFPNIGLIFSQIFNNIGNAIQAPLLQDPENISRTITTLAKVGPVTVDKLSQRDLFGILVSPLSPLPTELTPLVEFMSTPISGAILAGIGPVIGPLLSISNSIKAIFAELKAKNPQGAFTEFMNLAPNAVNAFLNGGQILDLTKVINRVSTLPDSVKSIGLNMGGIVSSGLTPVEGSISQGVSGSMFDGLAADASVKLGPVTASANTPGLSVGPIGATQLLTKRIAQAIKVTLPQSASTVAPAAAEVAAPAAIEAPAAVAVADEAPAPKPQARAAKTDKGNTGRAERGARRGD